VPVFARCVCITEGVHTITCTAKDVEGTTTTGSYTVTFVEPDDTTKEFSPPKFPVTLIQDATIIYALNNLGAEIEYDLPLAYDSEDGVNVDSVTCDPPSGSILPLGLTQVICKASDSDGFIGTGALYFTVEYDPTKLTDKTPPVIDVRFNPIVQSSDATGAIVTFTAPTATDPPFSGTLTVTCNPSSGSQFPIGTNTVIGSTTDKSGNTSTKSFGVIIEDPNQSTISPKSVVSFDGITKNVLFDSQSNNIFVTTRNCVDFDSCLYIIDNANTIVSKTDFRGEAVDLNLINSKLYIASQQTSLFVIDSKTGNIDTRISVCDYIYKVRFDDATNSVIAECDTAESGQPFGVATAYHSINPSTNTITKSSPIPFSMNPETLVTTTLSDLTTNDKSYTLNRASNTLSILDVNTQNISSISVKAPIDIAVNSQTNTIYVIGANMITVIDGSSNSVIDAFALDGSPVKLAVNESAKILYVIDRTGSKLSLYDIANPDGTLKQSIAKFTAQSTDTPVEKIILSSSQEAKQVDLAGIIDDYSEGTPVILSIKKPDGTIEERSVVASNNGEYNLQYALNHEMDEGNYEITVKYDGKQVESFSIALLSEKVPYWVKNSAKWWSEGKVDDSSFVLGIQYLIKERILIITGQPTSSGTSETIPDWVKNTAGWWADGVIPESDFVNSIKYLIEHGLIRVG